MQESLQNLQEIRVFRNLELLAKQTVEGFMTGLHKSPFHGFSVEFAEHRLYNTGESIKNIDWKLYGRTEKLFVKQYEEETNMRTHIVIDESSSMLFPYRNKHYNKLEFSVYSAAALTYLLGKQRDAVGLSLFSDKLHLHTKAKSSGLHTKMIYRKLDEVLAAAPTLNKQSKPGELLHQIAEKIHKRSMIIIFSDMFTSGQESEEALLSALQHLKHGKHEVILFHVLDKKFEQQFDFPNRPFRFTDMETGESIKLNPNAVKDDYKQASERYFGLLKSKCNRYKIDFIEADIHAGFKEVLLPYLIKRSKLY
ncbi:MAG: DUF58 domain-containing protein [Bacteroidia bacterium]|nr:MAG: DUF58 domain-containing protein [Bacteroidia bacterium]